MDVLDSNKIILNMQVGTDLFNAGANRKVVRGINLVAEGLMP